jgi:transglutaminase-like putative cysteine protease
VPYGWTPDGNGWLTRAPNQDLSTPIRRRIVWDDATQKSQWIDGMAYTDAKLPLVRELGTRFARSRDPNDIEGVVRDLHRFVRDSVRYIPDPSYEEISDSQTILENGYGDCDDKARLFVALCRSVGIDSRIRPIFDDEGYFYHVQAEAKWPGSARFRGRNAAAQAQPNGWILCELILKNCELGQAPATMSQSSTGARVLT